MCYVTDAAARKQRGGGRERGRGGVAHWMGCIHGPFLVEGKWWKVDKLNKFKKNKTKMRVNFPLWMCLWRLVEAQGCSLRVLDVHAQIQTRVYLRHNHNQGQQSGSPWWPSSLTSPTVYNITYNIKKKKRKKHATSTRTGLSRAFKLQQCENIQTCANRLFPDTQNNKSTVKTRQ